jgi:hypothetical protein
MDGVNEGAYSVWIPFLTTQVPFTVLDIEQKPSQSWVSDVNPQSFCVAFFLGYREAYPASPKYCHTIATRFSRTVEPRGGCSATKGPCITEATIRPFPIPGYRIPSGVGDGIAISGFAGCIVVWIAV